MKNVKAIKETAEWVCRDQEAYSLTALARIISR